MNSIHWVYGVLNHADVFERFKDQNGNFKECLSRDVKGMLSLYEASFHGNEEEEILDEAKGFTCFHLRDLLLNEDRSSSILLEQVGHALEFPLHRTIQRLEARWYTEAYEKRKDANRVLLEAAKLVFNIVQSTHQKDLQQMSRYHFVGIEMFGKLIFSGILCRLISHLLLDRVWVGTIFQKKWIYLSLLLLKT